MLSGSVIVGIVINIVVAFLESSFPFVCYCCNKSTGMTWSVDLAAVASTAKQGSLYCGDSGANSVGGCAARAEAKVARIKRRDEEYRGGGGEDEVCGVVEQGRRRQGGMDGKDMAQVVCLFAFVRAVARKGRSTSCAGSYRPKLELG